MSAEHVLSLTAVADVWCRFSQLLCVGRFSSRGVVLTCFLERAGLVLVSLLGLVLVPSP